MSSEIKNPETLNATPARQALNAQGAAGAGAGTGTGFRTLGNPGPAGLFGFASTTLILSLINVQTDGVVAPNVVVGMALFFGGLVQLLAGMWEFACGNTFGATAFSGYGAFWLSFALFYIPGIDLTTSYTATQGANAIGFYLATWFIFTFILTVASLRSSLGLFLLFFFLTMTFLLLTISNFIINTHIVKAGGAFGIITAFIAYYVGAAQLLTPDASYVRLPLLPLPKRSV